MSNDDSSTRRIGRRTILRRSGVLGAGLVGISGVGATQDGQARTYEADTSGVTGLDTASITVTSSSEGDRVGYEYSWDPEVVQDVRNQPAASLELDLPGQRTRQLQPTDVSAASMEPLSGARAVAETASQSAGSGAGQRRVTTAQHWDMVPFVESNSLLCGTLAETFLGVVTDESGGHFDESRFDYEAYDDECRDEWYVPGSFDTHWFVKNTAKNHSSDEIAASARFYNDDFPLSDRVYVVHYFNLTESSHDFGYFHYGDLSYILLEAKSRTGYL